MNQSDHFDTRPFGQKTLCKVGRIHKLTALGLATILTAMGIPSAYAELPALNKKPWLGFFAVLKNRNFEITIDGQGEMRISPHTKDGKIFGAYLAFPISMGVEAVLPDGKTQALSILPDTLESTDPATDKLEKTIIRGKVTGGAAFEATIEEARGAISIGGRVTDPGTATTNPLRFHVRTTIPYFYGGVDKDTPQKKKDFEATIKDDYIETKFTDGKRHKQLFVPPVDAGSPEMTGPGIASAEIGLSLFQSRKFLLSASDNSAMKLANANQAPTESGTHERPLYEGIVITWAADPAKDPQGKARLAIQVK